MRRRHVLALGWAGVLAGLARGGASEALRLPSGPPRMILQTGSGALQRARLGTFCWTTGCADYSEMPHPTRALQAAAGESLRLKFGRLGSPRHLIYGIWPYDESVEGGYATEEPVASDSLRFPTSPLALPDDLPSGLYVIDVYAFVRRGDTAQGFKLRIAPDI